MGTRLPQSDSPDYETTEFGIAALDAHLDDADITYPIEAKELVSALDNPEIAIDVQGHATTLSEIVEQSERRRFESEQDVLNGLHPVFEAKRESSTRSVIESLRSILPF